MWGFSDWQGLDISPRVNAEEAIGTDRGRPKTVVFWSRCSSFNHALEGKHAHWDCVNTASRKALTYLNAELKKKNVLRIIKSSSSWLFENTYILSSFDLKDKICWKKIIMMPSNSRCTCILYNNPTSYPKINYSPKKMIYTIRLSSKNKKMVRIYCLSCLFVTFRNSFKC